MFGRSTSNFDRLLEKATSQLLLEPDWSSIMMICDSIRQGDTNPKYAVAAIKKKFYHNNPHVALYALQVMESCVKNCGVLVHEEISNKQFMEELRDLVKQSTDENIKTKVLELLQTWGMAFRNSPKYRIVTDTLNLMKAEGWKFPPVREAEAMFEADTAPEWSEGDVCHRCRVQFSTFTRQHHCRACGQVFCAKCSAKVCVLPKFGIEREVRVCDSCFDQHSTNEADNKVSNVTDKEGSKDSKELGSDLPAEYLASPLSKQPQEPVKVAGGKTEAELKEEEELQLVLALSKSEAEEKEKEKKKVTSEILAGYGSVTNLTPSNYTNGNTASSVLGEGKIKPNETSPDPELEKYLNRDYWERRESQGTGPVSHAKSLILKEADVVGVVQEKMQGSPPGQNNRAEDEELDEFTSSLRTQLEIFVNRMKSNSSRGRPIANDSSVQTLFMNVMTMHGKLVRYIQEQEDNRVRYEGFQDKLAQVKDARAALDALREEEKERKRREQEELERQRQVQLAAKLEVMRKKKAEYLEYQRQVALQRMADQEREVAKLAEANKANYLQQQQGMYNMYLPYGYPQQGMLLHAQQGIPGTHPPGMGPPGNQVADTLPTSSADSNTGQPGIPFMGHAQPGGVPPGPYPGYPYGQQHVPPPPDQTGAPPTASDPSPGQPGLTTTTSQQGSFNMTGLVNALPQQIPYMGQPQPQPIGQVQQPQGQPHLGYMEPQPGVPYQPGPGHMAGPDGAHHQQPPPPQQPQPDAPAESLISFD